MSQNDHYELREEVIKEATSWQLEMQKKSKSVKGLMKKMDKLLSNPKNKLFLIELLDQSFRGQTSWEINKKISSIINKYDMHNLFNQEGIFNFWERILIFNYYYFGWVLPFLSVKIFKEKIRFDSSAFVIKSEKINDTIDKNMKRGVHSNINMIGESVLGELEAKKRLEKYIDVMKKSNIGHIAIKLSTIYSQMSSIAMRHTIDELVERLTLIYRAAKGSYYTDDKGNKYNKWVHLDMEEYRDLEITTRVFFETLDQEEFRDFERAGIALQAYLPDTIIWYEKILDWARKRVESGGAPVKIRLVKGANMEMESTEASLRGWELVTYREKVHTDANYKKILNYALKKENAKYVKVGVASHNLFDVVYGYLLGKYYGSEKYIFFEMLEGMAEKQGDMLLKMGQTVLLYVPTADKKNFTSAIGYLVRRLDENTSKDNFMRYSFGLKVGTPGFEFLKNQFRKACELISEVRVGPYRLQDRGLEKYELRLGPNEYQFKNEADTDFILPANRKWIQEVIQKWKGMKGIEVGIEVVGTDSKAKREVKEVYDFCQEDKQEAVGKVELCNKEDMEKALENAFKDRHRYSEKKTEEIYHLFSKVADLCRKRRGDLIGVAAAEVGKTVMETDVEITEAIDFINYYSWSIYHLEKDYERVEMKPKGVVVVISPWNFPIAIPIGGIAAALAAGNRVIFKPSSDALLCGYYLCELFWDSGISKEVLQYVPAKGRDFDQGICQDKRIKEIILTGGEKTGLEIMKNHPGVNLNAETGGKNAIIIGTMSDVDLAVKDAIISGFYNSGQKCSACSLLLVPEKLYNKEEFRELLRDATESLKVGSVWDLENSIGRLVKKPSGALKQALEKIEDHEEWLVAPKYENNNAYFLRPSIRIGTRPGDFTHMTELFGPHISVMKYKNIEEAIAIVNQTGYGLTGGLHSLNEDEKEYYKENIEVGNIYINRTITGAIVLRQPFGGMKKSAIGKGRKVGYDNYTLLFKEMKDREEYYKGKLGKEYPGVGYVNHKLKDALDLLYQEVVFENREYIMEMKKSLTALESYLEIQKEHFNLERDRVKLRGQDNIIRYRGVKKVLVVYDPQDSLYNTLSRLLGAKVVAKEVYYNVNPDKEKTPYLKVLLKLLDYFEVNLLNDTDEQLAEKLSEFDRTRYGHEERIPEVIKRKAAEQGYTINSDEPLMEGRIELLNYYQEQSLSMNYHRYGNLGERGIKKEKAKPVWLRQ